DIEYHARCPEILGGLRPIWLVRKRVAELLPMNQVGRTRDLDVDPVAVAQRLRRVSIIIAIVGVNDRGIREILVEDRIDVRVLRCGSGRDGAASAKRREISRIE